MDQEQVDPLDSQVAHGPVEGGERKVAAMRAVAQLGGDEQLAARHAGFAYGLTHAFLVQVALRRVDGAVSGLDGPAGDLRGDGRIDLPDAEPDLRDAGAIIELDCGRHGLSFASLSAP